MVFTSCASIHVFARSRREGVEATGMEWNPSSKISEERKFARRSALQRRHPSLRRNALRALMEVAWIPRILPQPRSDSCYTLTSSAMPMPAAFRESPTSRCAAFLPYSATAAANRELYPLQHEQYRIPSKRPMLDRTKRINGSSVSSTVSGEIISSLG